MINFQNINQLISSLFMQRYYVNDCTINAKYNKDLIDEGLDIYY